MRILNKILNLFRQDHLFGATRSPQWRQVRKKFLREHPACAVCEKRGQIRANEVHHVVPVHIDPGQELKESNFITLCRQHHFLFGHLLSWFSYNPEVRYDAAEWNNKIINRS